MKILKFIPYKKKTPMLFIKEKTKLLFKIDLLYKVNLINYIKLTTYLKKGNLYTKKVKKICCFELKRIFFY